MSSFRRISSSSVNKNRGLTHCSIFFQADGTYPAGATNEPVGEWPMEFLDFPDSFATNDVYGKLFYYLRDMLVRFQEESKRINISIEISSLDIPLLMHRLHPDLQFDRILVSLFQPEDCICMLTSKDGRIMGLQPCLRAGDCRRMLATYR